MNVTRRIVLFAVTAALWLMPVALYGQQPRTFTNQAGKSLAAVPLRMNAGVVELKRVPDGQVFQIQVSTLSAADQQWLAAWAAGGSANTAAAIPGGWSLLRVHLPLHKYTNVTAPEVVGLATDAARVGAGTFELLLPQGAWVQVTVVDDVITGRHLDHLIRFGGDKEWKFSADGGLLMLSRDGAPAKVVGITLPDTSPEKFLASVDPARCEPEISLDTTSRDLKIPEISRFKIAAINSNSSCSLEELNAVSALKPKALCIHLMEDAAQKIDTCASLEAMLVRPGRDTRRETLITALGALPPARDLSIHGFAFTPTVQQSLEANAKLRMLHFHESDSGKAGVLQWKGVAKNTSLEALHMMGGVELDAAEVAQLPVLRSLTLSRNAFPKGSAGLPDLVKLTTLVDLELQAELPEVIFDKWVDGGGLAGLVKLVATSQELRVGGLTKLRMLDMDLPYDERHRHVAEVTRLPELRVLALSGVGKSDMPTLAGSKNKSVVEALDLRLRSLDVYAKREYGSDYVDSKDLSQLAGYTGLKRLEVSGGNIKQFDLAHFPVLELLKLRDMDELKQLIGLAAAQRLLQLELTDCKILSTLGTKAKNTVLLSLELGNCPELADITALHQTSALKYVTINRCDKIPEPLALDTMNSLHSLWVRSCALLKNRSMSVNASAP